MSTQLQIKAAAAALANKRGERKGMPHILNVLDLLPDHLRREVMDDAKVALQAAEIARIRESSHQMTLGAFIQRLSELPEGCEVLGCAGQHSYRGYYEQLAFAPDDLRRSRSHMLNIANECMGATFDGWKGGKYTMTERSLINLAPRGCCGKPIVGITDDGIIVTGEED